MQPLRSARFLARLVLAWFALVVLAAAATPAIQPQALELVCSGGSLKLVAVGDLDDGQAPQATSLDCPLCMAVAPPPPASVHVQPRPLGLALQPTPAAHIAVRTAAPPPARGPPSSFA